MLRPDALGPASSVFVLNVIEIVQSKLVFVSKCIRDTLEIED